MLPFATLVKASAEDITWLYPAKGYADIAAQWLDMGPSLVVVTLGENGAIGMCADAVVSVPGVRVEVADTVGAGDAFMSALLAWLDDRDLLNRDALASLNGDALADALSYATRAAAIACTRSGAEPPTQDDIAQFKAIGA